MPTAKLVIIDDDAAQLELSAFALAKVLPSVQVQTVHLRRGEDWAIESDVDLVLMDYLLGGTTATAVLPRLRQQLGAEVPVVVFSNTTEPWVEREVVAAGAAALVGKPFSLEDVRALAQRLGAYNAKLLPAVDKASRSAAG